MQVLREPLIMTSTINRFEYTADGEDSDNSIPDPRQIYDLADIKHNKHVFYVDYPHIKYGYRIQ